jgi:hypothetical protein
MQHVRRQRRMRNARNRAALAEWLLCAFRSLESRRQPTVVDRDAFVVSRDRTSYLPHAFPLLSSLSFPWKHLEGKAGSTRYRTCTTHVTSCHGFCLLPNRSMTSARCLVGVSPTPPADASTSYTRRLRDVGETPTRASTRASTSASRRLGASPRYDYDEAPRYSHETLHEAPRYDHETLHEGVGAYVTRRIRSSAHT